MKVIKTILGLNHEAGTVSETFGVSKKEYRALASEFQHALLDAVKGKIKPVQGGACIDGLKISLLIEDQIIKTRETCFGKDVTSELSDYEKRLFLMGMITGQGTNEANIKHAGVVAMMDEMKDFGESGGSGSEDSED